MAVTPRGPLARPLHVMRSMISRSQEFIDMLNGVDPLDRIWFVSTWAGQEIGVDIPRPFILLGPIEDFGSFRNTEGELDLPLGTMTIGVEIQHEALKIGQSTMDAEQVETEDDAYTDAWNHTGMIKQDIDRTNTAYEHMRFRFVETSQPPTRTPYVMREVDDDFFVSRLMFALETGS